MALADGFPRELLAQPADRRLAYFAARVVAHPRLQQAHRALLHALQAPTGAALILVYGPTGVGKTTLRRRIEQQLLAAALPDLERDPGRVPVVGLEAVAPESGQFNWKDYYTRALLALDEPLAEHKRDLAVRGLRRDGGGRLRVAHTAPAPELRRALEQCLRQRQVEVVIVDEAQHLRRLASGRRLLDQMDTLKSLAALTGTRHVLVGTYELLGLADLSAQLSRRSAEIHFGRYHAEVAADRLAFQSVLLTFQRHLPLAVEPDLVGRWEELYERSVGCVGVLKNWLQRALAAALAAGEPTLTGRRLEQQADPTRKLLSLARELAAGEAALAASDRERGELRRLLGLAAEPGGAPPPLSDRPRAPRRPGRAGERRPTRDPVGAGRSADER
jgi:type II secretory pathway predicted ATPase ExeA